MKSCWAIDFTIILQCFDKKHYWKRDCVIGGSVGTTVLVQMPLWLQIELEVKLLYWNVNELEVFQNFFVIFRLVIKMNLPTFSIWDPFKCKLPLTITSYDCRTAVLWLETFLHEIACSLVFPLKLMLWMPVIDSISSAQQGEKWKWQISPTVCLRSSCSVARLNVVGILTLCITL